MDDINLISKITKENFLQDELFNFLRYFVLRLAKKAKYDENNFVCIP